MKVNVSLVQDNPEFFKLEKTIDKIERIVLAESESACDLIVFPESFIPGYPRGFHFAKVGSRSDNDRELYKDYYNNSIGIQSKETKRLIDLSKKTNTYLVIGVTEKDEVSGSLYCSTFYISPTNGLMGVHRKIKPTASERIFWAESDGSSLLSFDTKIGKLGGLICWENYMPLARMSMYKQAVQIYIAPTADSRDEWTSTMRHIALEGRCFVIGCNQYFNRSMYPEKYHNYLSDDLEEICPGGSLIVSPMGKIIEGPVFGQSKILRANLDLDDITASKLDFDVIGHYSRNDIFELKINNQPNIIIESELS